MNPRLWDTYDQADRLHFRQRNMLGHGTVTLVDDTGPVQDLQYEGYPTELRYAGNYHPLGLVSVPLQGATLFTLHQGGQRAFNSVVGVMDARYRPTSHQPGEFSLYMVDGAGNDGAGGTMWQILQGLMGAVCKLFGKTMVIGDGTNTTMIDVYGKTSVTIHSPSINLTNGGVPSPVVTLAGPSTVVRADA
jgi:hypothetical protein